ncbi:hypothetical protein D3C86_664310 [compost metagenome]
MVGDLLAAIGGIERNGNSPGEQGSEEDGEEGALGGKHQGDGLTGSHSLGSESAGDGHGFLVKRAVFEVFEAALRPEPEVNAVGMPRDMPLQDLDQGSRFLGQSGGCGSRKRRGACFLGLGQRDPCAGLGQRFQEVAGRFGDDGLILVEADREVALESREQLHPSQAVQSEIPRERAV